MRGLGRSGTENRVKHLCWLFQSLSLPLFYANVCRFMEEALAVTGQEEQL
jgi:hypothetical protein